MQPYLLGISGGSASGKTYILNRICEAFSPNELTLISQDNYYKDLQDQIRDENGDINFDHPETVRLELLQNHLEEIIKGNSVSIREYNFNNPLSHEKILTYNPSPLIIIEGLFVFLRPEVNKLLNLRIFLDVDEHIKLTRRIKRDISDRGFDIDNILEQYQKDVVPMYRKFIEPLKSEANIILPNNNSSNLGVDVIINHLKTELGKRQSILI